MCQRPAYFDLMNPGFDSEVAEKFLNGIQIAYFKVSSYITHCNGKQVDKQGNPSIITAKNNAFITAIPCITLFDIALH